MSVRKIFNAVFVSFVLFVGVVIVNTMRLYKNPALANNFDNFIFDIVAILLFAAGLGISLLLYGKTAKNKIVSIRKKQVVESQYKDLIEDSGFSSIVVDKKGIIRFMSENVARLTGYQSNDLIGIELLKCMPREYRPIIGSLIENMSQKDSYDDTIQLEIYTVSRVNKWISTRIYPVKNNKGEITELILMIWDIEKERKMQMEMQKLEAAQKEQNELLQTILDYCPSLVYIKNLDGDFVVANSKIKNIYGVKTNEELKDSMYQKLETQKQHDENDAIVKNTGKPAVYESELALQDGRKLNLLVQKFPMFNKAGAVEAICGFATDITYFKESESLILDAKKEAENAKDAQEIFLANVSHEIRTPLNGIVGMGNLLLNTKVTDEQRDYLESVQESAKNLLAIINDLLDFSKIKSGKFHLESIDFKPREVIRKMMYPLLLRANEKGLALKCYIDTDVPETIAGDALRFQQIVINLIGNAIKFTDTGSVEVKVYPVKFINDSTVLLGVDVQDTGVGIPEDRLENIFESYVQSDTNISRIYGGTGLGLAIVKQLAELQNGKVSATSTLGTGSLFTVQIPYKVSELSYEMILSTKANGVTQQNILQDIKVLVVEDNIINQKVVKQTLSKQNAIVEVASNGKMAIDKLSVGLFDIILMDLQMPEMDGYAATQHIREVMNNNIPIVAMTADAIKGESDKCFKIGMNDYISKPFEPADLYKKILHLTQVS